ncbi:unnamed protein product [Allacma fusca]|uniref:Uncharacterized protein n=1 Tax=Allacma fusca TaxID=39272 RepID=A0A8J2JWR1_9HEXA|nr:unnamed protein product [Allacma fusca]
MKTIGNPTLILTYVTVSCASNPNGINQINEDLKAVNELAISINHYELKPTKATFWTGNSHHGKFFEYNRINEANPSCNNIPEDMLGKIHSVSTHGGCVRVYLKNYCSGENFLVTPVTFSHFNMVQRDTMQSTIHSCFTQCLLGWELEREINHLSVIIKSVLEE